MFESYNFESIMESLLSRVSDDVDKREGSIIYDALAPVAAELAQYYLKLDVLLNQAFADTADYDFLVRRCAEFNIKPYDATYCEVKGVFNKEVDIGSRFSCGEYNYAVKSKLESDNTYVLVCENAGSGPNITTGRLIPIDYIDGLTESEITEILVLGEDAESVDSLRKRLSNAISQSSTDGNVSQYRIWVTEYNGVGGCKIIPLWNGGNTVKIYITNSENDIPSQELVDEVQDFLDPNSEGLGMGKAPIGAKVTVASAEPKDVAVDISVKLTNGFTNQEGIEECINKFLRAMSFENDRVSYMSLGASILKLESISDITNLLLNGNSSDVYLNNAEIPVLSTLNVTVVS